MGSARRPRPLDRSRRDRGHKRRAQPPPLDSGQRVRDWRASEVYEGEQLVSSYHAREMAWCASSQLGWFGECRVRFFYGVLPRRSLCPLFDIARAVLDVLGENTPNMIEIRLPPRLGAILAGEGPPLIGPPVEPTWRIPDSPPADWDVQPGEDAPDER